jgi:8-oxo-dGTP pyrophosphatase MutT (NUDIX family)
MVNHVLGPVRRGHRGVRQERFVSQPIREAATVMVVRDAPGAATRSEGDALEVLMMRRATDAVFVGGAHVFPGGAVDDGDRDPAWVDQVVGFDAAMAERVGTESPLSWYVAAARELFEEAGVLPARRPDGSALDMAGLSIVERFATHRRAVDDGDRLLLDVLREEQLVLDLAGMAVVSHWITPDGQPRRFDTRFFVAPAPLGQEASHDERETTEGVWIRPGEALRRHAAGEIVLILPTIRNLEALRGFGSAAEVLVAAAGAGAIPTVAPLRVVEGGRERFVAPDATGTEWADRARPGVVGTGG